MPSKKTVDVVFLPLEACDKCPYCHISRYYTADSFEQVSAWNCHSPKLRSKYKGKNGTTDREVWHSPPGIALVETFDKVPAIPKWCPFRKKKKR